ncbi:hypothetical protein J2Z42_002144 [Clostridium algifaecis]|uniref:site-specific DNA-methyltransferase (adenine-specific) n=1 Tax=Clostridium algifaecis TaxID=1472040 RepID=A0ABS4KVL4_9CLOT|nr:TaqI-like C-terminal specificity domain-containing protein [Clostridium algifaecis]MBP2033441.1 hypothetical protein [Clostridium algifaecis]
MDKILGYDYENSMNRGRRKKNGAFYTPSSIVDYIIKNTMDNLDIINHPFVKVIDPSCGCGYFLVKAYQFLFDKFADNLQNIRRNFLNQVYKIDTACGEETIYGDKYWSLDNLSYHILKNCIYGADIDNEAVKLTKANLKLISKMKFNLNTNIICCNSLIKWNENFASKKGELSCNDILIEFWNKKYDYVIGNPPWVSLSRKFKNKINRELIEYYISQYNGSKYLPNLYEYFVKRAFEILNCGGRIGFLIPDRFASNIQYRELRKHILKNYNICRLNFEVEFPGINTDTMVFIAENRYENDNRIFIDIKNEAKYNIYQGEYVNNHNLEFSYERQIESRYIKKIIEKNTDMLGDICVTFTGFIGNKKVISKIRKNKDQIHILKGENIKRYGILNSYYYDFIEKNIKGGTKNPEKLSHKNKVIMRKTGKNIIAALDRKGYIIEQSLYGIIPDKTDISVEYILAILNSKLIQWYYINFLVVNYNSIPQIKKYSLDSVPIKRCSESKKNEIIQLVDRMIDSSSDSEKRMIQRELDDIIFELYGISDDIKDIMLCSLNG